MASAMRQQKWVMPSLLVLAGICGVLAGAFGLFFCWAFSMVPPQDPDYYSTKLSVMLNPHDQLWLTGPSLIVISIGMAAMFICLKKLS
jgi:hypothetical protein